MPEGPLAAFRILPPGTMMWMFVWANEPVVGWLEAGVIILPAGTSTKVSPGAAKAVEASKVKARAVAAPRINPVMEPSAFVVCK
jgi:hypothetical protein